MSSSQSSFVASPKSGDAVPYFKHFPKSFQRSYGKADENLQPQSAFPRLHSWNCEWLSRPGVAVSELPDTLVANLEVLRKYKGAVLSRNFVDSTLKLFNSVLQNIKVLNN